LANEQLTPPPDRGAIAISNPLTPDEVIAVSGQKFPFPGMFFREGCKEHAK